MCAELFRQKHPNVCNYFKMNFEKEGGVLVYGGWVNAQKCDKASTPLTV